MSGPSKKTLSTPPKLTSTAYSYRQIRDTYDRRLGFDRLLAHSSDEAWAVNCSTLARVLNAKWRVALDMMIAVQQKALGCTFLFKPAKQVLAELMSDIKPELKLKFVDSPDLKAKFSRQIRLLHTTGGSSTLTESCSVRRSSSNPSSEKRRSSATNRCAVS